MEPILAGDIVVLKIELGKGRIGPITGFVVQETNPDGSIVVKYGTMRVTLKRYEVVKVRDVA